jgi:hypothetical protein
MSGTEAAVLNHFKNLVYIARKDGHLDVRELILLHRIAERNHIPLEQADALIETAGSDHLELPTEPLRKLQYILNSVAIMLADKVLFTSEFNLCVDIARRLGFRDEIIGIIVRVIKDNPDVKNYLPLVEAEYGSF